jgi:transcription initiation factor TFIIIB Brf1 subunit/transcription initiation factor TFIIB
VRGVVAAGIGACPLDPTSRLVALVRSETARAVRTQQEELAIEALPETVREPLRRFVTRTGLPLLAVADRVEALLRTADADRVTAALRDAQGVTGWKAWDAVLAAVGQRQRAVQFWFASPSGRGEA